ncbi:DNA-binding protein [Spirochaetia bacterium]|nr:DNA-binding protein [Spirochaetia bacterium]
MSVKAFFDTNIIVYTQRTDAPDKTRIAESALAHFDAVVSTQVLNELCNIFTKKYPKPLADMEQLLDSIADTLPVVTITPPLVRHALRLHHRYSISYFDALMAAAAIHAGCTYLFSEDMQDGLIIEGTLTIVNILTHIDLLQI